MRVSHGCIHMLPGDIEYLFPQVSVGAQVPIINQLAKVGWHGDDLYVEMQPPLVEDQIGQGVLAQTVMMAIDEALFRRWGEVDEAAIEKAIAERSGMPAVISE